MISQLKYTSNVNILSHTYYYYYTYIHTYIQTDTRMYTCTHIYINRLCTYLEREYDNILTCLCHSYYRNLLYNSTQMRWYCLRHVWRYHRKHHRLFLDHSLDCHVKSQGKVYHPLLQCYYTWLHDDGIVSQFYMSCYHRNNCGPHYSYK